VNNPFISVNLYSPTLVWGIKIKTAQISFI